MVENAIWRSIITEFAAVKITKRILITNLMMALQALIMIPAMVTIQTEIITMITTMAVMDGHQNIMIHNHPTIIRKSIQLVKPQDFIKAKISVL
jgi:hypothetical protein